MAWNIAAGAEMSLQTSEIARREGSDVQLRGEPTRIEWTFDDLVAADGHALRVMFSASVRALSQPADRRMFEEVFLGGSRTVTAERIAQHFQSAFRNAAAKACEARPAAEWIQDGNAGVVSDALKSAGQRVAFSCGVELLPPFDVTLESPTLERQRVESMQRNLAERRAAGQVEHFQRSAELLKQFHSIRQSAPQLSPGEVLNQLSPADQGPLLQTLLLAAGKEKLTEAVYAVAGASLLTIDPRKSPPRSNVTALPATLGPLRSVQQVDDEMLVGARSGIFRTRLAAEQAAEWVAYTDPGVTSQLGFNAAVLWDGMIVASHGEAGVVAWKASEAGEPFRTWRPADLHGAAPKNLVALDDQRLLFSSRDTLLLLSRSTAEVGDVSFDVTSMPTGAGAEVIAVLPEAERVTLVFKSGVLQLRDRDTLSLIRQERRSGAVSAATLLPWLGSTRLLLATEEGPILCLSWDDDLITQYLSPHRELRAITAAHDVIGALSGDRQRLLLWQTWSPRVPVADVYVPSVAKNRAADVAV